VNAYVIAMDTAAAAALAALAAGRIIAGRRGPRAPFPGLTCSLPKCVPQRKIDALGKSRSAIFERYERVQRFAKQRLCLVGGDATEAETTGTIIEVQPHKGFAYINTMYGQTGVTACAARALSSQSTRFNPHQTWVVHMITFWLKR
jgi:hypothetical protein